MCLPDILLLLGTQEKYLVNSMNDVMYSLDLYVFTSTFNRIFQKYKNTDITHVWLCTTKVYYTVSGNN